MCRSMNPATIRLPTPWTLTNGHLILTRPTCISKLDCSFSVTMASLLAYPINRMLQCRKTCILSSTKLQVSGLLQAPNGVYQQVQIQYSMALAQQSMAPHLTGTEGWQRYRILNLLPSLRVCTTSANPFVRHRHRGR